MVEVSEVQTLTTGEFKEWIDKCCSDAEEQGLDKERQYCVLIEKIHQLYEKIKSIKDEYNS